MCSVHTTWSARHVSHRLYLDYNLEGRCDPNFLMQLCAVLQVAVGEYGGGNVSSFICQNKCSPCVFFFFLKSDILDLPVNRLKLWTFCWSVFNLWSVSSCCAEDRLGGGHQEHQQEEPVQVSDPSWQGDQNPQGKQDEARHNQNSLYLTVVWRKPCVFPLLMHLLFFFSLFFIRSCSMKTLWRFMMSK